MYVCSTTLKNTYIAKCTSSARSNRFQNVTTLQSKKKRKMLHVLLIKLQKANCKKEISQNIIFITNCTNLNTKPVV